MNAKRKFTKAKLIDKYRKPTLFIRLFNFFLLLKEAFLAFKNPATDQYNSYPIVHIWGNAPNSNLYTNDDISIVYNMKEGLYYLCIETAYLMENQEVWGEYLKKLLRDFTEFMNDNGFSTNEEFELFMKNPSIELKAPTIEELYTNYLLFVNAFCNTYDIDPPSEMFDEGGIYV